MLGAPEASREERVGGDESDARKRARWGRRRSSKGAGHLWNLRRRFYQRRKDARWLSRWSAPIAQHRERRAPSARGARARAEGARPTGRETNARPSPRGFTPRLGNRW